MKWLIGKFNELKEKCAPCTYLLVAFVLSLGAPLGWYIIKKIAGLEASGGYELALFLYITFGTSMAFLFFAGLFLSKASREAELVKELAMSQKVMDERREKLQLELSAVKERMLKINQFGAKLMKAKTEEDVYYNLAYSAHVGLDFDRIIIYKREGEGLIIVEARGIKVSREDKEKLDNLIIPCSSEGGALGIACKNKRPFIFTTDDFIPPELRLKPPYSEIEAIRSRSFLLVPVCVEGEEYARAVIAADRKHSKRDVTNDDLLALEILCDMAATALARMKLEKYLESLATIDGLTGVLNRRAWMEKAQEELERAKRYKYPFAIVMLDIDDFKRVNDTWGHLAGDNVLRTIGNILKECSRKVDCPGRYGGEEFVLLMPHTTGEEALVVAERLRKTIEETNMGVPTKITATFGVSWFDPENPDFDLDQILLRADKALYYGKRIGKNRVVPSWTSSEEAPELMDFGI